MLENGFIILHRSLCKWRWFKDATTSRLFVYLILQANYEPHDFEDITVQRGQLVTSYPKLADTLGVSVRQIRTALNHLKSTGEVTVRPYPKYSLVTVTNYDTYQAERHDKRQSSDRASTVYRQSSDNNETKITNKQSNKATREDTLTRNTHGEYNHVQLTDDEYSLLVKDYGKAKTDDYITKVDEYCEQYGRSYKNYNLTIRNWIKEDSQNSKPDKSDKTEQKSSRSFDLEEWERFAMNVDLDNFHI